MKIKYELGDLVYINESIYLYKIIEIKNSRLLLEFKKLNGKTDVVWVNEDDIEGFVEGTIKYLDYKMQEMIKIYGYECILDILNKYKTKN